MFLFRFLHTHLENMKGFKLDVPALVSQHIHHELEVLRLADVFRHDGEVMSVQEKFAEELKNVEGKHAGMFTAARAHTVCLEHKVQLEKRAANLQRLPFGDVVFRVQ